MPSFADLPSTQSPQAVTRERGPRGARGGAQARMSGAQKRAARAERERAILKGTLEDDVAAVSLGSDDDDDDK